MKKFASLLFLSGVALSVPTNETTYGTTNNGTTNGTNTYEYVVIGSGPGGGTLAANLARAGHSTFLIEAGEDNGDDLLQQVPWFADFSSEEPGMTWFFYTRHYSDEAQERRGSKVTYRTTNGSLYTGTNPPEGAELLGTMYPRTGTLGGCSNHNAGNWAMPPDADWDHIAELTGDDSWRAPEMRRHFEDAERCLYLPEGTEGHGFDGPISVIQNNITYVLENEGLRTIIESAYAETENITIDSTEQFTELMQRDINNADPDRYQQEQVRQFALHVDGRRRRSSAQTYLTATMNARNADGSPMYPLTVSTSSLATRVVFEETNGRPRAVGVDYLYGQGLYSADSRYDASQTGEARTVRASKEVIVSGGAFNTPQILMLSGIGPADQLAEHDIPLVADLPAVGRGMQDNYEAGIWVRAAQNFTGALAPCRLREEGDPCLAQWEQGYGPLGDSAAPVGLTLRSSVSENDDADLMAFGGAGGVFRGHYPGFSTEAFPLDSFFWSVVKMQPQNRAGTVTLRSANPRDVPDINFRFFEEGGDHDLQALSEGLQHMMRIFNRTSEPWGPFETVEPNPEIEITQAIRNEVFSHHVTSTCQMGPANGTTSCVDSKFRVHGVDGLRVVDGSIFPRTPGAFPVAPTFVISQKATADILGL